MALFGLPYLEGNNKSLHLFVPFRIMKNIRPTSGQISETTEIIEDPRDLSQNQKQRILRHCCKVANAYGKDRGFKTIFRKKMAENDQHPVVVSNNRGVVISYGFFTHCVFQVKGL